MQAVASARLQGAMGTTVFTCAPASPFTLNHSVTLKHQAASQLLLTAARYSTVVWLALDTECVLIAKQVCVRTRR